MRFGFHFLDFTLPGSPASLAPTMQGGTANPVADPDAFLRYAAALEPVK